MALIKCAECGKEISDKASACMNCGCPIEKEKKKIRIIKSGGLALRCSVFIDNQPVGQIGIGSNKNIEIEVPIGTHYISTITQVKNQSTIIGAYGDNVMTTPITTSTSQEQDGKQFEVKSSDELTVIEILTKGSWSGSTGRCIVGDITTYDKNNIDNAPTTSNKSSSNNFFQNHLALIIAIVLILLFLFSLFNNNRGFVSLLKTIIFFGAIIGVVFFFINKKKKK